ncbi:MAG: DDE-type integrase/transposase/recombinase [Burkholderiales bacterium]|jgi:putative transposase|nr:DDE-type integrase/transposase/recombinase [Burkholderiales bacterium]
MPSLTPGSFVIWNDQSWLLLDIPETTRALLKHPKTGKAELVDVLELKLSGTTEPNSKKALVSISQKSWQEIQRQFSLLQPLLRKGQRQRTYKDIDQVAKQLGKGRVTIYRWLNKLENSQTASALLRDKRRDFGVSRLSDKINDIITDKIDNFYLVKERPSVVELWEQVAIECKARGLKPPAISTIHKRLDQVQDRLIMAKRFSHKKAREKFEPLHGSFPGANVPLAVYQVDHTPADIILVDDVSRLPIGRPYLTIVVDTCTRMLSGFCLTLDPPSALSTGLALTHAILPKKTWLTKHQIDAEWPIYGVPHKIYADNAKEFRGTMLERACHEYGIIMENRPKGLLNYGGHVERLFRTFMRRVQSLKGSTFSNVQNRGEYNSEGKAVFTLNEFEHWFGIFVTKVYHQRPHRGIGRMSPIKLYERQHSW